MPEPAEDPILRSARREAIAVFVIWAIAFGYTVLYCYLYGYGRSLEDLTFVLGIPDWVFWGIVAPWTVCTGLCTWFAFSFIEDTPLGSDTDDDGDGASRPTATKADEAGHG